MVWDRIHKKNRSERETSDQLQELLLEWLLRERRSSPESINTFLLLLSNLVSASLATSTQSPTISSPHPHPTSFGWFLLLTSPARRRHMLLVDLAVVSLRSGLSGGMMARGTGSRNIGRKTKKKSTYRRAAGLGAQVEGIAHNRWRGIQSRMRGRDRERGQGGGTKKWRGFVRSYELDIEDNVLSMWYRIWGTFFQQKIYKRKGTIT